MKDFIVTEDDGLQIEYQVIATESMIPRAGEAAVDALLGPCRRYHEVSSAVPWPTVAFATT